MTNVLTTAVLAAAGDGFVQRLERGDGIDYARTARFVVFRVAFALPLYMTWLRALDALPLSMLRPLHAATVKALTDVIVWAPPFQASFFVFQALGEGEAWDAATARAAAALPSTLPKSAAFWCPCHLITFGVVPPSLRMPFVTTAQLAWNMCLSSFNSAQRCVPT